MKTFSQSLSDKIFDVVNRIIVIVVMILIAYPLFFIIIASFSDPNMVNSGQVILWPKNIMLNGYQRIFEMPSIWQGYRNTIYYATIGCAVSVSLTISGGFALSQKSLPGKHFFVGLFTFTMLFNGGLIPTYLLVDNLGLIDSVWAMVLPGAISVWNLIIARTFFINSIPDDLYEAAQIDGSSQIGFFFRIVIPISKALVAIIFLYYFVGYWNEFFKGIIYLRSASKHPLQLVLRDILIIGTSSEMTADIRDRILQQKTAELVKYGVIIVSTLPLMLVYPFIQKYFVKGVLIGSVKG